MAKRKAKDSNFDGTEQIPIPIQTFLWRQTCPFIRPKQWKQCETSCVSFERVIVQNILHALSPSLCEAIESISRWRLVKASLPHVIHCCKTMLERRKESASVEKFTSSEIKLLYTLHWIILDAASECEDVEADSGRASNSFHNYLHSLDTIQLFVYLLVPLISQLRESDFNNLKLESGLRIWQTLWQYQQPDIACFSTPVKAKLATLKTQRNFLKVNFNIANIYIGKGTSNDDIYLGFDPSEELKEEEPNKTAKDSPSAPLARMSDICALSANGTYLSNEQPCEHFTEASKCFYPECRSRKMSAVENMPNNIYGFPYVSNPDVLHATYFDVAVLQCLFQPQWQEEGIDWALQYILRRIVEMSIELRFVEQHRERSKSLPVSELKLNVSNEVVHCRKDSASVEAICIANAQLPLQSKKSESRNRQGSDGLFVSISRPEKSSPVMFQMGSIDSVTTGTIKNGDTMGIKKSVDQLSPTSDIYDFTKPTITITHDQCELPSYPSNASWFFKNLSSLASPEKLLRDEDSSTHLQRCMTDSTINYGEMDENEEVVGSTSYIQSNGQLKYSVILRAIYNIASRKYKPSIYLNILRILEVFIDFDEKEDGRGFFSSCDNSLVAKLKPSKDEEQNDKWRFFSSSMETIFKILSELGCVHGCGESIKGIEGLCMRKLVNKLLASLEDQYKAYFKNFLTKKFLEQSLINIIQQMHSLLGFCLDPPLPPLQVPQGNKKPLHSGLHSKSYENNFGEEEASSIESKIIKLSFKDFLDKFVQERKEINTHENIGLYGEIQLMLDYVKQSHGSTFRVVALSGLIDCMKKLKEEPEKNDNCNAQDILSVSESIRSKNLFKKKNKQGLEAHGDFLDDHSLPRHSIISDTDEDVATHTKKKKVPTATLR